MEDLPIRSLPIVLSIVLLLEYGGKQWVETNMRGPMFGKPWTTYALFRGCTVVLGLIVFTFILDTPKDSAVDLLIVPLIFSCEILLAMVEGKLAHRLSIRFRWAHALPMAAVVGWLISRGQPWIVSPKLVDIAVGLSDMLPWATTPERLTLFLLGFVFLAHPANFLIRCFIVKEDDAFLSEAIFTVRIDKAPLHGLTRAQLAAADDYATEVPPSPSPSGHRATADPSPGRSPTHGRSPSSPDGSLRVGRTIGILERWIVAALTVMDQIGVIGLVLTAKSITRFKRFEQDPDFAEYYLLGTLSSIAIALVVGVLLKHV